MFMFVIQSCRLVRTCIQNSCGNVKPAVGNTTQTLWSPPTNYTQLAINWLTSLQVLRHTYANALLNKENPHKRAHTVKAGHTSMYQESERKQSL